MTYTNRINKIKCGLLPFLVAGVLLFLGSNKALAQENFGNVNNVPTGTVTISGTPTVGQTLTVSNSLADEDGLGTITYQWNKSDGSITAWGYGDYGGSGAPTDSGYTQGFSTDRAFAALKSDGSITAWGISSNGGSGAPTDSGYTQVFSNGSALSLIHISEPTRPY